LRLGCGWFRGVEAVYGTSVAAGDEVPVLEIIGYGVQFNIRKVYLDTFEVRRPNLEIV